MNDAILFGRVFLDWAIENPYAVLGVLAALGGLYWLLNRKTAVERESERVVKNLIEGSRDRYDKLRPLR